MTIKTITVANSFGSDIQLTKEEFAKRWTDHLNQLRMISWEQDWQQKVDRMMEETRDECHREFDRLWEKQQ